MATDGFVQVDPNSTGLKIDTEDRTIGANEVQRQRMVLVPGSLPQGCLVYHLVAASGTNAHNVKATPGQFYGYRAYNAAGYQIFIKLHNTAATPTPGAGVAETIGLQAGLPDKDFNPLGEAFDTGIGFSVVKGIADSDTTGVAAGDCSIDFFFA